MKYCFICNPMAGKEGKDILKEKIRSVCSSMGLNFDILTTSSRGDATRLVKKYCEENSHEEISVYACGGDGTAGEVVNGVMAFDNEERKRIGMGLIPVGTGNDFVRNFSNKENFLDIEAQINSTPNDIDLLKCNDMYAINMINVGFDCEVVVKMQELKRHPLIPSKMAYIAGLVVTLVKKPGVSMKASVDGGETEEKDLLLTTFANGCFCGGGFHSNPNADINNGHVDHLFINNVSRTKFLSLVGSYKNGTHICEKNKKVLFNGCGERYSVKFPRLTNVSVDGEVIGFKEFDLSVVRNAIRFLVPKGCEKLKGQVIAGEVLG